MVQEKVPQRARSMPFEKKHLLSLVAPLLIVAVGLTLRLCGIDATSMWYDEGFSHSQASRSFFGMIYATGQDNYPPLHNFLLYVTIRLFGDSMFSLRMPSVLLGAATIWIVYRLGEDMFNRSTGLVAAVLLCVSVTHIWYSIEARMYALLGFTAALYVWAAFHAWTTGSPRRTLVLGVVGAVPLLYSHLFGAFIFVGINLAFALHAARSGPASRPVFRRWLKGQAIAAAIYLPWALNLLRRTQEVERTIGWIPDPSFSYGLQIIVELLSGPIAAGAICLVVLAAVIAPRLNPQPVAEARNETYTGAVLLLACWLAVPFIIAVTISLGFTSILHSRYLIGQLPAFCLLLALLVTESFRSPGARIAVIAILALPTFVDPQRMTKPWWREALDTSFASFSALVQTGDAVLLLPNGDPTFSYYVNDMSKLDVYAGEEALGSLMDRDRLWIISFRERRATYEGMVASLSAAGFAPTDVSTTPNITFFLLTRRAAAAPMEH